MQIRGQICNGTIREDRARDNTTEEKEPQEGKERKKKRGEGKGKTRAAPAHGRGNKKAAGRPAVRRTSPKAEERSEAKALAFAERATSPQLPTIMFFFTRPTIIQHFGWKSSNSPMIFDHFLKFRHFPKIRYKIKMLEKRPGNIFLENFKFVASGS
jgi:hypothetical protein